MTIKGQVISGEFSSVLVRQKSGAELELGELLVSDTKDGRMILQVTDLLYGSQISQEKLELVSGIRLEEEGEFQTYDAHLRHYNLAKLKSILFVKEGQAMLSKKLPDFFSTVREITKKDLDFFNIPKDPLSVGKLRSGSKILDVDISLDGPEVLKHHIIPQDADVKQRAQHNLHQCHAEHQGDDEAQQRRFDMTEKGVDTFEKCHWI